LILSSFPKFVRTGVPPFSGLLGMFTVVVSMASLIVT
jgi:hypothetical protein